MPNGEIDVAFTDATWNCRIDDFGGAGHPVSAADFGKLMADETEKWAKVIRAAGIKAE